MNDNEVMKYLDYTLLNHDINDEDLINFCENANRHTPAAICIFPEHIKTAQKVLDSNIAIAALVGSFPIGSNDCIEIEKEIFSAINLGADEIDIVLEPRNKDDYPNEIELKQLVTMRNASKGIPLKVIIETPLLSEKKIRAVTRMALSVGIDFVKTCTGKRGSCTEDDVKILSYELMRHELTFKEKLGMKISGGINDRDKAIRFIELIEQEDLTIINRKRFRIGASSLIDNLSTTQ